MSSFSDYLENNVLDHVTGKTAYTAPATYVALSTTAPTEAGGNVTEPVGNAYARILADGTKWGSASGGSITNSAGEIKWVEASGSWGTITHVAVYDAITGGNMLYYTTLAQSKPVTTGDTMRIPTSGLTITLD